MEENQIKLYFGWFPSSGSHRYTQVRPRRKSRHFGRDAEIQAMDGSQSVVQVFDSGELPSLSFPSVDTRASVMFHSLPSLDARFRHPCRNDGPPTLVYNDESSGLGTLIFQAPAWSFFGKLELQKPHSQA